MERKSTNGGFKMKGSPMQRNFGIGSPLHDEKGKGKTTTSPPKEELNEFGETPEEYKQRMIDMGLRKSDAKDEIDAKEG